MQDTRKLILGIDLANVAFCGYYGQKLYNSKGEVVNMITSFFRRIAQLKEQMNPYHIVFACDVARSLTFRREIYHDYKGKRPAPDPEITFQMRIIRQIVALLGYPMLSHIRYEADDCLGMLGTLCEQNDMLLTIISSDRDMYQLISDNIMILSPRKGIVTDMDVMKHEWRLTPQQWIELKMLQGDQSDNIPGIPGIGHKTALQLMLKYGTIDNIYQHLSDLPQRVAKLLQQYQNDLPLMRQLVTILRDPDEIHLTLDTIKRGEIQRQEIYEIIEQIECPSLYTTMNYALFLPEQVANDEVYRHSHPGFTHF